jgi:hypothetical protein
MKHREKSNLLFLEMMPGCDFFLPSHSKYVLSDRKFHPRYAPVK